MNELVSLIREFEGRSPNRYPAAQWVPYAAAVEAGRAVINTIAATQGAVDGAAAAIRAVRDITQEFLYAGDLAAAMALPSGHTQANYSAASWAAMQTVLGGAQTLWNNLNLGTPNLPYTAANQEAIDGMDANVRAAVAGLVNIVALRNLLAEIDALVSTNFLPAGWAALQTQVGFARPLIEEALYGFQVAYAITDVTLAREALIESFDNSSLIFVLNLIAELDEEDWTEESWAALTAIVNEANAWLGVATEPDFGVGMANLIQRLEAAIAALVEADNGGNGNGGGGCGGGSAALGLIFIPFAAAAFVFIKRRR